MKKSNQIQQTLWDLQKRFGDHVVTTLGAQMPGQPGLKTGYAALDALLGEQGIPKGAISVLVGIPTCGMTTLAFRLIANAQGTSEAALYLDLSGTFDADAAHLYGVAIERFVLGRPLDVLQSLEIARDVVQSQRAAIIVIDLLFTHPSDLHDLNDPLRRLHEQVKGQTAVVFLSPIPLQTLDTYTHTRLALQRALWLRQYGEVTGYQVRVTLEKHKPFTPGQSVLVDFMLDARTEDGTR